MGVLSILAFAVCLPIAIAVDTPAACSRAISAALAAGHSPAYLWTCSILSGFFFYLYNEMAFLALGRTPLTRRSNPGRPGCSHERQAPVQLIRPGCSH